MPGLVQRHGIGPVGELAVFGQGRLEQLTCRVALAVCIKRHGQVIGDFIVDGRMVCALFSRSSAPATSFFVCFSFTQPSESITSGESGIDLKAVASNVTAW